MYDFIGGIMIRRHVFVLAALVVAMAGCAPQEQNPVTPSAAPLALQKPGEGKSSLDLIEDDYANGLLDRENANRYREYAVSAPGKLPLKYRSAVIGKDATYSMLLMAREWGQLSKSTKEEILDLRADGFGNLKDSTETEHYVLHYTTQGDWAVPSQDSDHNGVPDFIDAATASWEHVWSREVGELGY